MQTKKEILAILKEIKGPLQRQYKIRGIWLLGSVLREEQNAKSDIDILVDFEDGADFFNPSGNSPPFFKAGMRANSSSLIAGQSLAPTGLETVSSTPVKAWNLIS